MTELSPTASSAVVPAIADVVPRPSAKECWFEVTAGTCDRTRVRAYSCSRDYPW